MKTMTSVVFAVGVGTEESRKMILTEFSELQLSDACKRLARIAMDKSHRRRPSVSIVPGGYVSLIANRRKGFVANVKLCTWRKEGPVHIQDRDLRPDLTAVVNQHLRETIAVEGK